jgi:hypothetical protein
MDCTKGGEKATLFLDTGSWFPIEIEKLAALTIPSHTEQDFILCAGILPAGSFGVKVSRTLLVHVLGAVQHFPATIFSFPEVQQVLPPHTLFLYALS